MAETISKGHIAAQMDILNAQISILYRGAG